MAKPANPADTLSDSTEVCHVDVKKVGICDAEYLTDLSAEAVSAVTGALNPLLADAFALYLKTKNFHWHMSGPHFRDYHLLLDEQGEQIFAMTDELAERVRKIGGATVKSIGYVARLQRIKDNNEEFVAAN